MPVSRALAADLRGGRRAAAGRPARGRRSSLPGGQPLARARAGASRTWPPPWRRSAPPAWATSTRAAWRGALAEAAAAGRRRPRAGGCCATRCRSWRRRRCAARGPDTVAFLPPPADGGLAAAAAFQALRSAGRRASGAGAGAGGGRAPGGGGGGDPRRRWPPPRPGGAPGRRCPPPPRWRCWTARATRWPAPSRMNNLFGTGRMAPGTGFLLAASPSSDAAGAAVGAALVYNTQPDGVPLRRSPASGQDGAPPWPPRWRAPAAHAPGAQRRDGRTGAGAGPRHRHRLRALPAGQRGLLQAGDRPARRRAGRWAATEMALKIGRGAAAPPFLVMDVIAAANARAGRGLPPGAPQRHPHGGRPARHRRAARRGRGGAGGAAGRRTDGLHRGLRPALACARASPRTTPARYGTAVAARARSR